MRTIPIRTCSPEMLQFWSSSRDLISLSTVLVFHVLKSLNHNPQLCSSSQTEEERILYNSEDHTGLQFPTSRTHLKNKPIHRPQTS